MTSIDILFVFQWWLTLLFIGVSCIPIILLIFPKFFDKGYIFAKIIGMILLSYISLLVGEIHLLSFSINSVTFILILLSIINVIITLRNIQILKNIKQASIFFIIEELLFLLGLFFWAYVRGTAPDIHGLEKFMDYGFVNSILRSSYFPPKDMWYPPFSINYYYFGHFTTAVITKLSNLPSEITFNLMLATLFSLTLIGSFSLSANLLYVFFREKFSNDYPQKKHKNAAEKKRKITANYHVVSDNFINIWNKKAAILTVIGALLTAYLTTFAGNLHTIYSFFKPYPNENPVPFWKLQFSPSTFPNSYWYPNATRFIFHTIHEFPIYSFVVSDLHGHVLDIPFVLLTLATVFSLITQYHSITAKYTFFMTITTGFLLAIMYMTNAWDGLIYFLLLILTTLFLTAQSEVINNKKKHFLQILLNKEFILNNAYYIALTFISFIIFSLPFSLFFKPFASQIGILCAPTFLTNIGHFGPFLFEVDHCNRSPFYQLLILHGFFLFWIIGLTVFLFLQKKKGKLYITDIFVTLLNILSIILIIIPEFVYLKDIYPTYYRANTMFKLVYEAFIMLSLTSGYSIMRLLTSVNRSVIGKIPALLYSLLYFPFGALIIVLISIYPYFAISSYYNSLQNYFGLDGTKYLQRLYPSDYDAIAWINANIHGQPVILEAQGDSYTDYARVSANTGLPTPLGWTVHEWLWRGSYNPLPERINDIQLMYETNNTNIAKSLAKKYNVTLVFVGSLEKKKYTNLNENKFLTMGKIIYKKDGTTIYQIHY